MSISTTSRKAGPYFGNGTTPTYAFAFKVFGAADVLVVRGEVSTAAETELVIGSDYNVSLNADQELNPGGTITLTAGNLASGFSITIGSKLASVQPAKFTNQGGFYPRVLNDSLDRLTILVQQLAEQVARSVKVGFSGLVSPDQLVDTITNASSTAVAAASAASGSASAAAGSAIDANDAADAAQAAAAAAAGAVSAGLAGKADVAGSAAQAFSVAPGTAAEHAVRKAQLDTKAELAGSATQEFSVAAATADDHAVRRGQIASGAAPIFACRAWVVFNGTGTVAIRNSGNVSSITDNGTGRYTVNFATSLPDENYAACATVGGSTGVTQVRGYEDANARSSSAWSFSVTDIGNSFADATWINASFFR